MSYPKQAKLFARWAKAMLDGATVDKPNYSAQLTTKSSKTPRKRRRRWRRKRKKNVD